MRGCGVLAVAALAMCSLCGCSGGGGSVAAFCSAARRDAPVLSGSSASAKAAALGHLGGLAPGEIASSVRALAVAYRTEVSHASAVTVSTLSASEVFRALAPGGVVAGPDGERVDRFLVDRCGLHSPSL